MALFQDHFPIPSDVLAPLSQMGLKDADVAALDIAGALDDLESELAELCGGAFLVAPNAAPTSKTYSAPDGVLLPLSKGSLVCNPNLLTLPRVFISNGSDPETELLEGADFAFYKPSAPQKNLPYCALQFTHIIRSCPVSTWNYSSIGDYGFDGGSNGFARTIRVEGVIGYGTRLSSKAFRAVVGGAVFRLYPILSSRLKQAGLAQNGALKSRTVGQLREDYVTLADGQIATLKTEAPLLGLRFDELVATLRENAPITA